MFLSAAAWGWGTQSFCWPFSCIFSWLSSSFSRNNTARASLGRLWGELKNWMGTHLKCHTKTRAASWSSLQRSNSHPCHIQRWWSNACGRCRQWAPRQSIRGKVGPRSMLQIHTFHTYKQSHRLITGACSSCSGFVLRCLKMFWNVLRLPEFERATA